MTLEEKVMSKDGEYLGILKNSLIDRKTGIPSSILVKPSKDINPRFFKTYLLCMHAIYECPCKDAAACMG